MKQNGRTKKMAAGYAAVLATALLASACQQGASHQDGSRAAHVEQPTAVPPPSTVAEPAMGVAAPDDASRRDAAHGDRYARIDEQGFFDVAATPLSTFSIDVDTASYSNARRFIDEGQMPPAGAVRIEEMVNYFRYDYPEPTGDEPFSIRTEVAGCPWDGQHRLVQIGLRGREVPQRETPPRNLVFLVDTSGSMQDPDKLPLVKQALKLLVGQLTSRDRIALVAYAGSAGLVLEPTEGDQKGTIAGAIDRLESGGSTAGGAGIQLAYQTAGRHFVEGGINRVILATDGDFNVGVSSDAELTRLIEEKRKSGVFLTVLGVGRGNLNDSMMEALADHGNGAYAYLDSLDEARKVLVEEVGATLVTIAKDVKVQVEFNPKEVAAYRLIGYEDRALEARDFNDDRKDAGEIGAGHTVTALYEVVPAGQAAPGARVDSLKYQDGGRPSAKADSGELMTVKLRYKEPEGDSSRLLAVTAVDSGRPLRAASADFRFAASVAAFGMLLRESDHKGSTTFRDVIDLASNATGEDREGRRSEFVHMVERASALTRN